MKKYTFFLPLLFALGVLAIQSLYGLNGPNLSGIGPLQQGTVGAGAVAKPEDSAAVLTNPAALNKTLPDERSMRFDAQLQYFMPDRYIVPRGAVANTSAGKITDSSSYLFPGIGMVKRLDVGTLGLGIYGVGGAGVEFDKSRTAIGQGATPPYDRFSRYLYGKAALAYAYPMGEGFTVGLGLHLNYAIFKTDMALADFGPPPLPQTQGQKTQDDAFGGGFQIGVMKEFEKLTIGASYTSRQWMEGFNRYQDFMTKNGSMDIPQQFQLGVAFEPTEDIDILMDYKFVDFEEVALIREQPEKGGFGWKSRSVVFLGSRWHPNKKFTLRGGINYGKSPVDDDVAFANALTPVVCTWHAGFGVSYMVTKNSQIHLSYKHGFRDSKKDSGSGDAISQVGKDTEISFKTDSINIGFTHFM